MQAVGLVEDWTCELPMTQVELADAVGTSTVHVNRVLQELRAAKLVALKGQSLTVLDWERLRDVSGFDPAYLHLRLDQRGDIPHAARSASMADPAPR
jgi:DNA-binding transcriptional regulator LsrR (DeoR family)